jgi:uncharacterized protein (TIGR02145 family)
LNLHYSRPVIWPTLVFKAEVMTLQKLFTLCIILIASYLPMQIKAQVGSAQNPCIENLSTEERDNLQNVQEGMLVFNMTTGCLNYYHQGRWREFCENKSNPEERIDFDEKSGKLKYNINGQWYTFRMTEDQDQVPPEDDIPDFVVKGSGVSTSNLPKDCQKKPTRAWAGRDVATFDNIELQANAPLHGIGFWKIMNGQGGTFKDSTVPNTIFTGVQEVTYTLRWSIATKCDTFTDDVLVRIKPPCDPEPSQSFAGQDQFNVEYAFLDGNRPRVGKGIWTIESGLGGSLLDPMDPKTKFSGKEGETYLLRWNIRNECGLTMDDVIIKIKPPCSPRPSKAYAGEDQKDVENCILIAERPENGKGKWSVVSGKGGKFINKDSNYTTFYGEAGETYVLRWTVSTKCGSTSDEINISFSTYCPKLFADFRDETKYKAMRIGKQCWMAENLRYRPPDGQSYCYDEYPSFCEEYGALYPWSQVMWGDKKEGSQGICPKGWHVPSDAEWQALIDSSGYTGIELQMGGESGFNIPMGGARYTNGKYLNRREYAYYWSSTQKDEKTAFNRYFPVKSDATDHFPTDKKHSFYVRCVKDD